MNSGHLAHDVANVVVEAIEFLYHLIGLAVWMVVTERVRRIIERFAFLWITCSSRCNDLNMRVGGLDRVMEQREAVLTVRFPTTRETCEPVFVADFDVVEREGLRMTKFCAALAPGGVRWAANEFNLVEGVVNEGLKVFFGCNISVQRKTSPYSEDW
jgi:hypothetical protein